MSGSHFELRCDLNRRDTWASKPSSSALLNPWLEPCSSTSTALRAPRQRSPGAPHPRLEELLHLSRPLGGAMAPDVRKKGASARALRPPTVATRFFSSYSDLVAKAFGIECTLSYTFFIVTPRTARALWPHFNDHSPGPPGGSGERLAPRGRPQYALVGLPARRKKLVGRKPLQAADVPPRYCSSATVLPFSRFHTMTEPRGLRSEAFVVWLKSNLLPPWWRTRTSASSGSFL